MGLYWLSMLRVTEKREAERRGASGVADCTWICGVSATYTNKRPNLTFFFTIIKAKQK